MLAACALAVVGYFATRVLFDMLFGSKKWDPRNKHCYIGGASEGLGLSLACLLASRGAHVTLVSRSKVKLEAALRQVEVRRIDKAQKFQTFACDLTDDRAAAETLNAACEAFKSAPDAIFACAGGCIPGMFTDVPAAKHIECLDWNFKTALFTIHEGVKRIKDEGKRDCRIVLTASLVAMMSFAGYSTYAPSKYAIRGLADSLRNELLAYGCSVHLFLPATIFSPGFQKEQEAKPAITKKIEGPDEGQTPDQVALHLLKGVERGHYQITYEPVGHMLRNSRGPVPRNNLIPDAFWGFAGSLAFPIWRMFVVDKLARQAGHS